MGKRRVVNDLYVKTAGDGYKKGQKINISGISTRKYYDSSNPHYRISPIRMNKIVSFAELAIRFYNINENTKFGQVKVRKVVRAMAAIFDNHITFKAFSPLGVATVFETVIREYFDPDRQFEVRYVRIKHSHCDHNNNSQGELQPNFLQQQTLSDDSLNDLAPCLSQYALVMYNTFTLRVRKVAAHDIPSLEVVRAVKQDAEGNTYLVTFEAIFRESRNVETFETQICVPSLFPTMIIQFKEIQNKHA